MIVPLIDKCQHTSGERGLEGAAHDKPFVGSPGELCSGLQVPGVKSDLSTATCFIAS